MTPVEIANVISALERGDITTRALRVFLAAASLVAVREAAKRSRKPFKKNQVEAVRFRISELGRLTRLSDRVVRSSLRLLHVRGLLLFTERAIVFTREPNVGSEDVLNALAGRRAILRPIPVPRRLFRYLSMNGKRSVIVTALVYSVRGLSLGRSGEVRGAGAVKASWIASVTGLSLRAVKSARKELISTGLVSKDIASFQRKLNRDGAYFAINFSWNPLTEQSCVMKQACVAQCASTADRKNAPPPSKTDTLFAPPYKDKKTSSYEESKNQKTQTVCLNPAGVSTKRGGDKEIRPPSITNILPDDLKSISRMNALFDQGGGAGWIGRSEADRLNWFSAAVRASTTEARDPVRIFVSIVRRHDWYLISQRQEERARRALIKLAS